MTGWGTMKLLVLLLLVAVVSACVADVVSASMPGMEPMHCSMLLCDGQTGCGPKPTSTAVLPIAVLATTVIPALPSPVTIVPAANRSLESPTRQVAPLAARSPPLV
jgi:hypothetical protein